MWGGALAAPMRRGNLAGPHNRPLYGHHSNT
jgi:hypothetical protein